MTKAYLLGFIQAACGLPYDNPYQNSELAPDEAGKQFHAGYWDAEDVHERPLKEIAMPGRS